MVQSWRGMAGLAISSILLILLSPACERSTCVCPEDDEFSPELVMTYLFREAWGDCPMGCIHNRYWYFECTSDGCSLVGHWDPAVDREAPDWWQEALVAMRYFRTGGECPYSPWPRCEDISKTPRMDAEAEEMALWLSGSLVAPDTLYSTVRGQLRSIREQRGDSVPALREISFFPSWMSNRLLIYVTSEALDRFHTGQYDDLDSLNSALGMVAMEYWFNNWLSLSFIGRLNPRRLVELYEAAPSVITAIPNAYAGDGPNVYPWVILELP